LAIHELPEPNIKESNIIKLDEFHIEKNKNNTNIILSKKDADGNNIKCYLYLIYLNLYLIVKKID